MQLATLMHSYSIFVRKEKYGRFPRDVFDDTVLEFIGETSETSEALQAKTTFTRTIRGALPLDVKQRPLP